MLPRLKYLPIVLETFSLDPTSDSDTYSEALRVLGESSLQAASTRLREQMGSSEYEAALGGRRLVQIIALFPGDFELTQNNVYVRLL